MSSRYDRTGRFLRHRFDRDPLAFSALALVLLWSLWTVIALYRRRHGVPGYGDYALLSDMMAAIGRGVIVAVGLVWLIDIARGRS